VLKYVRVGSKHQSGKSKIYFWTLVRIYDG